MSVNHAVQSIKFFALMICLVMTNSCRPKPQTGGAEKALKDLPATFQQVKDSAPVEQWRESLNFPGLIAYQKKVLGSNLSLAQMVERRQQAEALLDRNKWNARPSLALDAKTQKDRGWDPKVDNTNQSVGALLSWELDLWGKLAAGRKGSAEALAAVGADLYGAKISILGDSAFLWLKGTGLSEQKAYLEESLVKSRESVKLARKLYQSGGLSGALLRKEEQGQLLLQNRLALLVQEQQTTDLIMAQLCGQMPDEKWSPQYLKHLPPPSPMPSVGIPSEWLVIRPDLIASAARLRQTQWGRYQADLELLPSIKLSPRLSSSAPEWSGLFDSWLVNLVAQASAPLWDGRIQAARREAESKVRGDILRHREVVLKAMGEVEQELYQAKSLKEQMNIMTRKKELLAIQKQMAIQSYLQGDGRLIDANQATLDHLNVNIEIVQLQLQLWNQRLRLSKALGIAPTVIDMLTESKV